MLNDVKVHQISLLLQLENSLSKIANNWKAAGGEFDMDEARKRVIVRSRTSPLSLLESIKMEEDIARNDIQDYIVNL